MLARPKTRRELQATFDRLLKRPDRDALVPSETGLDDETIRAVQAVWNAQPAAPLPLYEAARTEFARQLDGTHARQRRARIARMARNLS